jgi:hypothetical protein
MGLPDQGAPPGPVLTATTLTRESLTSTNEARDIVLEVEIDMVNPGKNYLLDSSTLVVYPCSALWWVYLYQNCFIADYPVIMVGKHLFGAASDV